MEVYARSYCGNLKNHFKKLQKILPRDKAACNNKNIYIHFVFTQFKYVGNHFHSFFNL